MEFFKKLNRVLAKPAIRIIKIYQYTLSPDKWLPSFWLKGRICAHEPHCSKYSISALKRYGFWPGIFYATDRVLHCTASRTKNYDPEHYRVVFFSSAPIGVPFLKHLANDKRFEIAGVVTQCDKPAGRWMEMCECVIKQEAKKILKASLIKEEVSADADGGFIIKKTKILILHWRRWHGRENRFGWLKDTLEKQGHIVFSPDLPNAKHPNLQEQLAAVKQYVDQLDENSIIVGHSLWCLLANHVVTQYKKKIKAIINVAPASMGNDSPWHQKALEIAPELKEFIKQELDFVALKHYHDKHIIYLSDDDPYINLEMSKKYFSEHIPYAQIKEFTQHGHFNEAAGMTEFQEIFNDIHAIIWSCQNESSVFIATPEKLNPEKSEEGREFAERLKEKNPDLLVVIAYGKIIPQAILDIPKIAAINVHGSLLPKYRGASPIQSTLLNNDKETWITIMKMDATLDTGDMIDILRFTIPFQRTTKELIHEMMKIGPKFLNNTLRKYGKKLLGEVPQQESKASYCGKIEKESWLINPRSDTLETVYNKYRAYALRPKIYFMLDGKRVIIEHLKLSEPLYNSNDEVPLFQDKELNPAIIDIQLKPEGKKAMDWKEFLNGYMK